MLDSNFAPKVFFIMRDPIARIISAFRMAVDRQRIDPNKYHSIDQAFQDYSFRPNVLAKSKYEFTISNLESAFNRTELFIGFHEDMKTQSGLNNLGNFLDLHFDDLVKINSFNSSNFEFTPSPHTLALLKKELSSTYDYIKHHFKDYRF
jgi:hypothetical protein